MPAQPRRSSSRPTRAQRRSGVQTSRTYSMPAAPVATVAPRRTFMAEPAPVDHAAEFGAIRNDLRRILTWSAIIVVVMIALYFIL